MTTDQDNPNGPSEKPIDPFKTPGGVPHAVLAGGDTYEDAVKNACATLDATRDQIDVAVIEDGGSSFMHAVTGDKVRIRAVLKPQFRRFEQKGVTYLSMDDIRRIEDEAGPDALSDEQDLSDARTVLATIVNHIQPGTRVERFNREGTIHLRIISDGSGLFIGNKGQTLDSLQFVVNKIVQKATGDESIKIVVDSENYRGRKNDRIESLARRLGGQARKTGRVVTTDALTSFDRRTVHMTIRDQFPGIATRSIGDGDLKRVQIIPEGVDPGPEPPADDRPRRDSGRGRGGRPSRPRSDNRSDNREGGRPQSRSGGRGGRPPAPRKDPAGPIEIRGEEGFDVGEVEYEPIPEMVVDKKRTDDDES